jgi:hypothetical protein
VIRLDGATVLLQWVVGGLFFLWVTGRRREVGLGYGWLLRGVYGLLALSAFATGAVTGHRSAGRSVCALAVAIAAFVALGVSVARRRAGVAGQRAIAERRTARVAAMTGIDRAPTERDVYGREFPPVLDLVAPAIGVVGLLFAAHADGGPAVLAVVRLLIGAAFLGAVTDAMLLGHWYLVQPGLSRAPLLELVNITTVISPFEIAAMLWPTGMVSVWTGSINDGWGGTLGWFWAACAVTTVVLCLVTRKALEEKSYSAVMAATGLLYLAILTAFGTDLVARAVLAR